MRNHPQDGGGQSRAERLARAAHAARELSEAVWDCLQEQLSAADPARAQSLAERLAEVSATIAVLLQAEARADAAGRPAQAIGAPGASRVEGTGSEPGVAGDPVSWPAGAGETPAGYGERGQPEPPPRDLGHPPVAERRKPPEPVAPPPAAAGARLVDEQAPTATVTPLGARTSSSSQPSSNAGGEAEIEVHDTRREEGASAWISSVGRMLVRYGQDGLPFAVLLVEIVDVAQLERSETPHDLHGLVALVESALGRGMRASDELSRETLGRYWLLAPETNGTGARMLAERLAGLVRSSASHRGVPMEVAIGIAVCPDDGTEAPALAARADLGVYSARATGRSVARTEPPSY